LPPVGANEEEEAIAFRDDPYIEGPIKIDYGTNLKQAALFCNSNAISD
jgi:hypothetical protein